MIVIGLMVTHLIEAAVTRNSAASTALYVDSVIAPLLPNMQTSIALSENEARALDETLGQGALGKRLAAFRLWRRDGTVIYSSDKELEGKTFPPNDDLKTAFAGTLVAEFDQIDEPEGVSKKSSGQPFLEIYNPVLQPWSGEVVAVLEFYEIAEEFERSLWNARLRTWAAVAAVTASFFFLLSAIVFRGSETIEKQSVALRDRVSQLSDLLAQNKSLQQRIQRASQRTAALNESHLRRIGADLHDGPAQLVALAALELENRAVVERDVSPRLRDRALSKIKRALDDALREIRSICRGLVLPDIEKADVGQIIAKAVGAHEQRTDTLVDMELQRPDRQPPLSVKICIYRFVQEALSNAYRHGGGIDQKVVQRYSDGLVSIQVSDGGNGFDPAKVPGERLGLAGLKERVQSLGGRFELKTSGEGTSVTMSLPEREMETI
jgi:signal transduction histidine kinase